MTKRAVIYVRQSTMKQQSIPVQISALEDYAKEKGTQVLAIFKDTMSGKDTNREGFRAMKAYIAEHAIDEILVWRLDRVARNLKDLHQFMSECYEKDIVVFSLNEHLSNSKNSRPDNIFLLQVLGAVAEYQRSVIQENQQIAYMNKHQQGKIVSSKVPYGYYLLDNELQINEDEARIVRQIFHLYTHEKMGYKAIAEHLHASGQLNRNNKLWQVSRIKAILDNPFYIGKVQSKYGDTNTHALPLVTTNLFNTAQMRKFNDDTPSQRITRRYVLQKKILCPYCQTVCTPSHTLTRNQDYYYYTCSLYTANGKRHCPGIILNATQIEQDVSTLVTQFIQSNYVRKKVHAHVTEKNKRIKKENSKKESTFKNRQQKLIHDFEKGLIDDDQLSIELAALNTRKQKIKLEPTIPESIANLIDFNLSVANNPTVSQYILYQSIIERIEVDENKTIVGLYLTGITQNILEEKTNAS